MKSWTNFFYILNIYVYINIVCFDVCLCCVAASLTSGMCAVMQQGFAGRWTVTSCNSTRCYHVCSNSTNVKLGSAISASDSPDVSG